MFTSASSISPMNDVGGSGIPSSTSCTTGGGAAARAGAGGGFFREVVFFTFGTVAPFGPREGFFFRPLVAGGCDGVREEAGEATWRRQQQQWCGAESEQRRRDARAAAARCARRCETRGGGKREP